VKRQVASFVTHHCCSISAQDVDQTNKTKTESDQQNIEIIFITTKGMFRIEFARTWGKCSTNP
jgi:hypothetical protein